MSDLLHMLTSNWYFAAFAFLALCSTLVIIIVILSENRNPVKSLAWVTVLLLVPVIGLPLYIFFGRNIKNKRMISRRNRRRLRRREKRVDFDLRKTDFSDRSVQQIILARTLSGGQFYPDNKVEVYNDGAAKFRALEDDLRRARHSIYIQYYIFEDDELGRRIADILIERVRAGVRVKLLYDHVGSFHVKTRFFKRLREEGVEAAPFLKVNVPQLASHINWRNHRKICVIDDAVGYIGGMNVADRYIDGGKNFDMWRDMHMRIVGPAVEALKYSFAVDWSFMGGGLIDDSDPESRPEIPCGDEAVAGVGAQLVTSGPMSQWANIGLLFHKAICNAQRRVYIQTPYFLPTEALLKSLQAAALSHVDVRIMMPVRSDSVMLTHASKSYVSECLQAGIKFYLYKPGMLHSKVIIVDDELVSIGSSNFDFRSFECNFESNIFLYSREVTSRVLDLFRADQKDCIRIDLDEWRRRPLSHKTAESVFRLLSPVL